MAQRVDPVAGVIVLDELVGRGRGSLVPGVLEGRQFVATDVDWSHGTGELVEGDAATLMATLLGRPAALEDLRGPGASDVVALVVSG